MRIFLAMIKKLRKANFQLYSPIIILILINYNMFKSCSNKSNKSMKKGIFFLQNKDKIFKLERH